MQFQSFSILCLTTLLIAIPCTANDRCFNFSNPIQHAVKNPEAKELYASAPAAGIEQSSGVRGKDTYWASASGVVNRPIADILKELQTHDATRSGKVSEVKIDKLEDPHFLERQRVHFVVKPFLFVKVEWTEDWGFSLLKGSPDRPGQILASYEKTEGTSYISHLCGNIDLAMLSDNSTRVVVYEEVRARSRSEEDTRKGVRRTILRLRGTLGKD